MKTLTAQGQSIVIWITLSQRVSNSLRKGFFIIGKGWAVELARAYQALLNYHKGNSYTINDGRGVYNNGWSWVVVFQATNRHNYAIVKHFKGAYNVVEV